MGRFEDSKAWAQGLSLLDAVDLLAPFDWSIEHRGTGDVAFRLRETTLGAEVEYVGRGVSPQRALIDVLARADAAGAFDSRGEDAEEPVPLGYCRKCKRDGICEHKLVRGGAL